jgi:hypothetical protein
MEFCWANLGFMSLCYLGSIKELIHQYSLEARAGQYELSRALADFSSNDDNALNFRRGDIIAIVPREDAYTQRGWLYGVKVRRKKNLSQYHMSFSWLFQS